MEDKVIKTHKFSEYKLQNLISEDLCRTLRFDILNLDYNIKESKDKLNPNCAIYEQKEFVQTYVKLFQLEIGNELRSAINHLFSYQELEEAYHSKNHSNIYNKLYDYFKSKNYGMKSTNHVICLMLDYRLNGYLEEEIHRVDY